MNAKWLAAAFRTSVVLLVGVALTFAQESKALQLPKPQTDGGRPLMQVLKDRKSSREFSDKTLSRETLSNLLWAAFGVNRPQSGRRTAPSAVNWQEIEIYVAMPDGLYLFDAKEHALNLTVAKDLRALAGRQEFMALAPLDLIFVANFAKMGDASDADKTFYSAADTGFISQNVYLFCASEGLATVVVGLVDRESLAKAMELRPGRKITLTQPVGYPK
jgi:SagB-type dehydrogenase family enzyme